MRRHKPHEFGEDLMCPDCGEEARHIPPLNQPPGWARPCHSHRDGSALCPGWREEPGTGRSEFGPLRPTVFVPLAQVTTA
ncbi:hypothetical protein [Nocardiopsis sp. LOL_012]|uniref:hypothetical protein n=1 Tax=Nocardiopsis sp. LOL_012 TaxID=3345409 RepID=UPI003A85E0E4